jgi:enterochelin esterase family protein
MMLIITGGYAPRPIGDPCPAATGQITRLTISSKVYGQPVPVSVYVPPCAALSAKRLPAIYLLHGASADETQWPDLRVQAEADALMAAGAQPFVVIMPGGVYRSDIDYASFVLNDLIPSLTDRLHLQTDSAGRAVGGLSMGGYWALKLAFQHPDPFVAVGGYSPVVASRETDLVALAGSATGLDQLHIALDVGRADALAAGTQRLAQALQERGLAVALTLNDGGHNRPYWRAHTAEYLRFLLAALTTPEPAPSLMCYSH